MGVTPVDGFILGYVLQKKEVSRTKKRKNDVDVVMKRVAILPSYQLPESEKRRMQVVVHFESKFRSNMHDGKATGKLAFS